MRESQDHFDVIIIGAGLSGLATAVRLGMFGLDVLILEKHYVAGGLNSFYAREGRKFDVGLHALTNFPSDYSGKSSPLLKLCRQLRIPIDSLNLREQSSSRISFDHVDLRFNNDFEFFLSEVEKVFPKEKDSFLKFISKMEEFPAYSVDAPDISTRKLLKEQFNETLLGEMLLCPTCYYGSARSNDIDFATFVMLFDAIFKQGLARPLNGIRSILDPMISKLEEMGVQRRMNCPVKSLIEKDGEISRIELATGETLTANHFVSTCGGLETEKLLDISPPNESFEAGRFSIIESISVFQGSPTDYGWDETIVFFNETKNFTYDEPKDLVDLTSGVICLPENYGNYSGQPIQESKLRITHPANFDLWNKMGSENYYDKKKDWASQILENGIRNLPNGQLQLAGFQQDIQFTDTFTPRTIKKFTNHENGALYGSPTKKRSGMTNYKNLFIAGTDQGYVGIVGAMLGGIAVANNQILKKL